ncbi:MAG: protein kinase domain-containing protein [Kofleriaceae bacterium]
MSARDPRSRDHGPDSQVGGGREPTQSLSLSLPPESFPASYDDDDEDLDSAHSSLARGTHDVGYDERTKIESPGARTKTPAPAAPRTTQPPPAPRGGPPDEPDRVGSVLGSYKIVELLGKGGMGYVFRAEHVKLGREVALKLLRSDYARRRDAVARFFQEARTVNRVRHRNIVDVTDFVELPDHTTFIIMELLRGQSLGKWARTGIDMPRALAVLVQICDGLAAAHQVGVVHRDLKPDNVIVVPTSDGAELVKLLDFGVAKLLNHGDEDIGFQTAAGSVIGTPAYMSPEQAGGMVVDARSDIYSLGAIMYELFCGQPMFRGRSFGEFVRKHLTELPVPPRATPNGAGIDPRLEALILRCLEKEPTNRFAHIVELRDALLGMLGMETLPPGYASMTASGLRPMSTALPSAPLPQLPVPPSGGHPSQGYYSQHYSQVAPPPVTGVAPPVTPWWVWLAGGAVAIGIGVGAAVWYAGRTEAARAPAAGEPTVAAPTIATATELPPMPARGLFEVRFHSVPSAGVYAEGQTTELCRTPCVHNIDLRDGGATESRSFLVRSPGYKDAAIVVDLRGQEREFKVSLERRAPEAATTVAPPASEPPPATEPPPAERTVKKPARAVKTTRPKQEPAATEPPRTDAPPKVEPKPTPEPQGTIDPTDTLDPFRRKR